MHAQGICCETPLWDQNTEHWELNTAAQWLTLIPLAQWAWDKTNLPAP